MFYKETSQKLVWIFIVVLISISAFSPAQAGRRYFGLKQGGNVIDWGTDWQPPSVAVALDLKKEHPSGVYSNLQVVCYDVLEKENKPSYGYLAVGFHLRNLDVEPAIGYSFRDKELVGACRLYPKVFNFRSYFNLEYQPESQAFYYQAQTSLKFSLFFDLGLEAEGWGDLNDDLESNGFGLVGGFNLHNWDFFKGKDHKIRIEAALQLRELMDEIKPQAVLRIKISPDMDESTKPKRRN